MTRKQKLQALLECQRIRHRIAYRLRRFGYCVETQDWTPSDRAQRKSMFTVLWYRL